MLSGVVSEQRLLVLSREAAVCGRASVGPAVREDLVYLLLEVLHDQVVLFLSVLVLRLGFEAAQLARVRRSNPVHVLGQAPAEV